MIPRLLILDVDGVMTDGSKTYDIAGNVMSKRFNDLDFTAIKRFKQKNVEVCFLTGDDWNQRLANKRKISIWIADKDEKLNMLHDICKHYRVCLTEVMYVGDDIYDSEIMRKVGKSVCVKNSPMIVKELVDIVLPINSGEYVVSHLFDVIFGGAL